ncbi:transposase [Mycetocola reblochoni]|uniref:transposase n=1 Tax=Mycetocola reblochoni TaxID=331618 RepID=UPI003B845C8E
MWSVMEPLMPIVSGRSRPWTDHRLAVEGMAWKYRTGAPWRDVPERFGKWNSIYKRFNRWAEDRPSPRPRRENTTNERDSSVDIASWMSDHMDASISPGLCHSQGCGRESGWTSNTVSPALG